MSNNDPSVVKYIITSDEYDRLKHFEVKCQELFEELKTLKESKSLKQVGKGDYYVVDSGTEDTPVLKVVPNNDSPLINFSVPLIKNDENDDFDEQSLLHLVPADHKNSASLLLNELKRRGNELTWNSSGIIFIDQVSIPNSNIFFLFPYLFYRHFPTKKIEGLLELQSKLKEMGLGKYFLLNTESDQKNELHGRGEINLQMKSVNWYFLGLKV